jgi:folate-binding protein YgfZ
MLLQRLQRYKLRADIALAPTDLCVHVAWSGVPDGHGTVAAPDPRLPEAGWRLIAASPLPTNAGVEDWNLHRLGLGLPDGSADLEAEKTVLLEAGFDELNGVSWTKGCYMGQELTARTRYRGLIKRRLLPVRGDSPLPPRGTPVISQGREIGQMRSSQGTNGLATLRLEAIGAVDAVSGGIVLSVIQPGWAKLPEIA